MGNVLKMVYVQYLRETETGSKIIDDKLSFKWTGQPFWIAFPVWLKYEYILLEKQFKLNMKSVYIYPKNTKMFPFDVFRRKD